ncbi:hypothetical protein C8R44DRAFT_977480 [Mycena epipterygia]|nr:hypothetical protein C8R44DRAFT_977480 [Mycena epipterygia]
MASFEVERHVLERVRRECEQLARESERLVRGLERLAQEVEQTRWEFEEQQPEERERRERERQCEMVQERLARRAQLLQQLEAPPGACTGGLSLNHLSSLLFLLVLAAVVLELVGWFIFLGLLVTILVYLVLIISPSAVLRAKAHIPRVASLLSGCMDARCSPGSRPSSGIWRVYEDNPSPQRVLVF